MYKQTSNTNLSKREPTEHRIYQLGKYRFTWKYGRKSTRTRPSIRRQAEITADPTEKTAKKKKREDNEKGCD